jgi:hypothetical protein
VKALGGGDFAEGQKKVTELTSGKTNTVDAASAGILRDVAARAPKSPPPPSGTTSPTGSPSPGTGPTGSGGGPGGAGGYSGYGASPAPGGPPPSSGGSSGAAAAPPASSGSSTGYSGYGAIPAASHEVSPSDSSPSSDATPADDRVLFFDADGKPKMISEAMADALEASGKGHVARDSNDRKIRGNNAGQSRAH